MSPGQHCNCKIEDGRWKSSCALHAAQFRLLARLSQQNHEATRRPVQQPAPREVRL